MEWRFSSGKLRQCCRPRNIARRQERLGVDRSRECWGGGKRKDLVNQVFTRLRDALEVPSVCKLRTPPSVRNVVRSSEGVDGGA
jgi:hypothetical protein